MRSKGWLLAAALVVTPVMAHADGVLDKPHQALGQGVALVVEGRFAEAEKYLRDALRMDSTLPEAHYNLAVALRNEGRYDEAIAEYHHALGGFVAEPDRAKAFYGIGLAREARGDRNAWDEYLAFARPFRAERPAVAIARDHEALINGEKVPGSYQKAAR
ncbi:MAG TPA: tetratricopeptide repeat protein [Polyangia bacterium]|nr:tetratricopeptide repeat protein [Polyangia bacterium]